MVVRADSNEEGSNVKYNTEFGYSRKDVLLICGGLIALGYALYYGLQALGMEAGYAGNWVQLIIFMGICVGWVSTYIYRVATKVRGAIRSAAAQPIGGRVPRRRASRMRYSTNTHEPHAITVNYREEGAMEGAGLSAGAVRRAEAAHAHGTRHGTRCSGVSGTVAAPLGPQSPSPRCSFDLPPLPLDHHPTAHLLALHLRTFHAAAHPPHPVPPYAVLHLSRL